MMIGGGILLWFIRRPLMQAFSKDEQVVQLGTDYLLTACLTEAAYPILFVTVFMLQGLKRPAFALWMGLYRQIIGQCGIIYLLAFALGYGLWGVWWGISLVTWSGALFAVWWASRVLRAEVKA
jgi:Na+-driven multidrug efflux pump